VTGRLLLTCAFAVRMLSLTECLVPVATQLVGHVAGMHVWLVGAMQGCEAEEYSFSLSRAKIG
jgi:hypothetical protein